MEPRLNNSLDRILPKREATGSIAGTVFHMDMQKDISKENIPAPPILF